MPQQLNQRTIPVGGDEPKRAWFDEYARSDRGILEFATVAAANTWAADASNAGFAVDGRHAWITGENAVYVRQSGTWYRAVRPGMSPALQHGSVTLPVSGLAGGAVSATTNVTFALPFPGVPDVIVQQRQSNVSTSHYVWSPSVTGFAIATRNTGSAPLTADVQVTWIAAQG